jgi:hypothetical protein
MATNCTSEDLRPPRRPKKPREEALAWAASALRSESLLRALRPDDEETDSR